AIVTSGRGAAYGDLFNDGKIDVVINNLDQVPTLLRNVSRDHHSWVELKLIGGPRSPRDAIGTSVYLTANGIRQRGDVLSGGSFMSSNDQRIHFGLGNAQKVSSVEIHWTSGLTEHVNLPGINRIFTVEEGKGIIR
ncbi:MAG: ASPIC/UnbV domain-containing protein, partial [Edaphobacter sp.]